MLRVIDLSRLLPGPFASLCLQGLGAEVIKIEEPGGGDYLRHFPPFIDGVSAWFWALNRGKKSVTLDLRQPADREALCALLADADVLLESFRPGVMARLGLDPQALRTRFPKLVIASLTGWGQTGPLAHWPGHDIGFMALAGLLQPPHVPRMQWADIAAGGMHAALRITGALLARHQTGQGAWLDIAMFDALVGMQQTAFATLASGEVDPGTLWGVLPNYNLYPCADDGWVSVGALEPRFLAPLSQHIPELDHARYAAFFASQPRDAWAEALWDACVVPVLQTHEVPRHPHVVARRLFDGPFPHPPTGPVSGPPPQLGEHTATELARSGARR